MIEQPRQDSTQSKACPRPQARPVCNNEEQEGISFSIVTYQTPATDLRVLLCGLARSRRLVQVTVVDNSPTQALRSLVVEFGATYISTGQNLGFGRGHNLAMRKAIETSKYHVVCNPDIRCGPDVLGELERFMDARLDVGLVMPKILYPDGREQPLCKMLPTPVDLLLRRFLGGLGEQLMRRSGDRYQLRHLDLHVTRQVPNLSGCFMFLRSSVLRQTGLFDPRFFLYMEDVDLCRRVGAVSQTIYYPLVNVTHGYAKGSYKNRKLMMHHIRSAASYFTKWGWLFDRERRTLNRRTEVLVQGDQGSRHQEADLSVATYAGTR